MNLLKKGYKKFAQSCPIAEFGPPLIVETMYDLMLEFFAYAIEETNKKACFICLTKEVLKQLSPPGSMWILQDFFVMRELARFDKFMKAFGLLQQEIARLTKQFPIDMEKEAKSTSPDSYGKLEDLVDPPPPPPPEDKKDEEKGDKKDSGGKEASTSFVQTKRKKYNSCKSDPKIFLGRNAYMYTHPAEWRGMEGPVIWPIPREELEVEELPAAPEVVLPKPIRIPKHPSHSKPIIEDPWAVGGKMHAAWGGMHAAETWIPPPCVP